MAIPEELQDKKLTEEEIAALNPQAQEFIRFCRDLTKRIDNAAKRRGPWIGCAIDHGIYLGHDPEDE